MSEIETHATPALLLFIEKNTLKLIHTAHNMEFSNTIQSKLVELIPTLQTSLHTCVSLTNDSMVYSFPCTNACIVYKVTPWVQAFFLIIARYIAKLALPNVFACGNFIECNNEDYTSALIAYGNSKALQYYTLMSIDIQPILAYLNKLNLYQFSSNEIANHIAMILANLNPVLSLSIKKTNTKIFYAFFHNRLQAGKCMFQPFFKLIDSLLQLPQTLINIVETNKINQSLHNS